MAQYDKVALIIPLKYCLGVLYCMRVYAFITYLEKIIITISLLYYYYILYNDTFRMLFQLPFYCSPTTMYAEATYKLFFLPS